MDRGTSPAEMSTARDHPIDPGTGPQPCPGAEAPPGPLVNLGDVLPKTMHHFWPEFNLWLDRVPDSRFAPLIIYDKRFLIWWGLSLYLFQLGSRRQLDFDL